MDLTKIKRIALNRHFLPIALFIFMDIVMLSFIVYLGYSAYNLYNSLELAKVELETTKQTANLIENNKELLEADIDNYNELLNKLIPDDESYFKVIAAFEQLGSRTGVSVDSYSINLDSTTEEKLSLELSVSGNRDSVENLLRDYNYLSGRLITNEDVTISFSDETTTTFLVNLIHKPYTEGGDLPVTISSEDVDFLNEILEKM